MHTIELKTNINCGSCIATATPVLNEKIGAGNWKVDIANPAKILTVSGSPLTEEQVIRAVEEAGFKAQPVQ